MRKEMKTEKLSNFLYGGVFLSHFSIQIQKGSEQEISAENEKVLCPLLTHITMVLHHDGGASVGERWLFIGISSEGVTVYGGVSYGEVPFPFFPSPRDHDELYANELFEWRMPFLSKSGAAPNRDN